VRRQRGSHSVLVKYTSNRKTIAIVPLHPELKHGTLPGVLELAGTDREEFLKACKGKLLK